MAGEWRTETVSNLQRDGILLVEDGNHGEYRPQPDEFVDQGVAFIRAADMDAGQVLFASAAKINERARQRITKGIGAAGDVLLSHKGTVGKVALVASDAPAPSFAVLRQRFGGPSTKIASIGSICTHSCDLPASTHS